MLITELLDETDFEEAIDREVAIVEFTAPDRCAPCRAVAPAYEQLAIENTDTAFYKINPDYNKDLAAKYGVMSVPAFFRFEDGTAVRSFNGAAPKPVLERELL